MTIPDSVTNIGVGAFESCFNLVSVSLGNGITAISNTAFHFCSALREISIPDSVKTIGGFAFYGCSGLTRAFIGKGVTNIDDFAFGFTSLQSIFFTGNAPSLYNAVDWLWPVTQAAIYYLPGTTGWNLDPWVYLATVWDPQMDTTAPASGMGANGFTFNIKASADVTVVVEACTNLLNPAWFPVGTNTLAGGVCNFTDPDSKNSASRFYRLRSP